MKLTNNNARFGWGFALFFLLCCIAFTYILIRDGSSHIQISPPSIPEYYPVWFMPLVMCVFWIAGLGLTNYMMQLPCVTVEIKQNKIIKIEKRYPFKKETREIAFTQIESVIVQEIKDSEGDPYFIVQLMTNSGELLDIAEGNEKSVCDDIRVRFCKLVEEGLAEKSSII